MAPRGAKASGQFAVMSATHEPLGPQSVHLRMGLGALAGTERQRCTEGIRLSHAHFHFSVRRFSPVAYLLSYRGPRSPNWSWRNLSQT
jgi:hypothetical protein